MEATDLNRIDPPPIPNGVVLLWRCEACEARVASTVPPRECPLCGGVPAVEGPIAPRPVATAIPVRHDRHAFARAALAFLATSAAVPDEVVAALEVPEDLVPLYVPFRRIQGVHPARASDGAGADPAGGACHVEVCVAPGLDDREATALEGLVAGQPMEECSAAPLAGSMLLGEIPESQAAGRALRLLDERSGPGVPAHAVPVSGEHHYLLPVWMLTVPYPGSPLRLLMAAGSGRFVGVLPPAASPGRSVAHLDVLGHFAWLPALFCLLLATLTEPGVVRAALCTLAAATLLGGYVAASELRRALARARMRLAVALSRAGGDLRGGDPAPARRRLVAMQRAVAWLPATYAGIAISAHLGVTAYGTGRAATPPRATPEAVSLVPGSQADAHLRASAFAPSGAARTRLASASGLAPVRAARPATGRVIAVGPGG